MEDAGHKRQRESTMLKPTQVFLIVLLSLALGFLCLG